MSPEVEAYITELVEQAPPLTPEQQALIVRVFGRRPETPTPRKTRKTRPDQAA